MPNSSGNWPSRMRTSACFGRQQTNQNEGGREMRIKTSVGWVCLVVTVGIWLSGCRPAAKYGPTLAISGPGSYCFLAGEAGHQPAPGFDLGSVAIGIWMNNGSN